MPADIGKDTSVPTIRTEHKTFPQQLKEKIIGIFSQTNQKSQETLQQLATQEIPQDSKNNQVPEIPTETQSPVINTTKQDREEITQLEQAIQAETQPPTEPSPETPFPQRFPERPSLYEQHHKEYEAERKTVNGQITIIKDIFKLKKVGIKKAGRKYDNLRLIGVSSKDILKVNYLSLIRNLPNPSKFIERLYSMNMPQNRMDDFDKYLGTLTDHQFNQLYTTLNKSFFLKDDDIPIFLHHLSSGIDDAEKFLPIFQRYFSTSKDVSDYNEFLDKILDSLRTHTPIIDQEAYTMADNFYINLILSKVSLDKKIEIPEIIKTNLSFTSRTKAEKLRQYINAKNRPEQINIAIKELIEKISGKSHSFSLSYLLDFILTPEVIASLPSEEQKLWKNLLQLKKTDFKTAEIIISNTNPEFFFNKDGQPTSRLFEQVAKRSLIEFDFLKLNLTSEVIKSFSLEDQKFWKFLMSKNLSVEKNKKVISDNLVSLIITNKEQLASTSADIDFLNTLIGRFGKKSELIIKNYFDSLKARVISKEDQSLVLEFLNEFAILTPNIIKGYKEAKQNKTEKLFISNLKEIAQKLTSSKQLTETEINSPYYQELIKHVYSNNASEFTSYDSNDSCSDRISDLSQFNIKDIYQIDLLSQSEIKVKDGEQANSNVQIQLEKPVLQILENLQVINFDKEVGNQQLHQQADTLLSQINLPNDIDLSQLLIEDKLFIITSESIYHQQNIDTNLLKELLITYEFVNFEDIRNFIQGTNDKVSQSSNPDYAHLCELSNFYSDRIKEVNKRIIESASTNPQIIKLLPTYFQSLAQQESQQSTQDNLNKLQTDKLGLTGGFVDQLTKTLQRRFPNKSFTPDQVKRMLHIYETITQGLTEPKSTSPDKNTQAFYGQFRSQREKTFALLKQLGNDYIDPRSIHLDEINLQQAVNLNRFIESGSYNQKEFLAYTAQKFIDIFSTEKSQLNTELSKYESESGSQREVLNAYITKTKSSANARMVGGVCVSGDNPIGVKKSQSTKNMWDTPNYFQMVFQDPENYQCRGLCLLHHFEENGKKILTVSFNPSSTYLYSVDESSLFNGIYSHLQDFASQNGFDIIATSQNKAIRTNRIGGIFEKAIDQKVSQFHQPFSFSETKQFSYKPPYQMKNMDVIWERQ